MIVYDLNKFSKVRVWFEPNKLFFSSNYSITKLYEFKCSESKINENKTIILELFIPAGGRVFYGLLGIDYKYVNNNILSVKINLVNRNLIVLKEVLLEKIENTFLGLPEEYLKGVSNGLEQAKKENKLQLTGEINFCYAAHGVVSSCNWIFQKLSYSLISLLFLDKKHLNREKLVEIFDKVTA